MFVTVMNRKVVAMMCGLLMNLYTCRVYKVQTIQDEYLLLVIRC